MTEKLTPNMEDYLEAIYIIRNKTGTVRVKDIARMLEVTMPSVSYAIKNLEKQGLVCHSRYDLVDLTAKGTTDAKELYKRHLTIKDFLLHVLGLDAEIAEKDACGMEHCISPETLERLTQFLESTGASK